MSGLKKEEKRKPGRPKGAIGVFSMQSHPEAWTDKWYPGLRARLGVASDVELGRLYKVSHNTIRAIRRECGIPACRRIRPSKADNPRKARVVDESNSPVLSRGEIESIVRAELRRCLRRLADVIE